MAEDLSAVLQNYLKSKGVPDWVNMQNIRQVMNVVKPVIAPTPPPPSNQNLNPNMTQEEFLRAVENLSSIPQGMPGAPVPNIPVQPVTMKDKVSSFLVNPSNSKLLMSVGALGMGGTLFWLMSRGGKPVEEIEEVKKKAPRKKRSYTEE